MTRGARAPHRDPSPCRLSPEARPSATLLRDAPQLPKRTSTKMQMTLQGMRIGRMYLRRAGRRRRFAQRNDAASRCAARRKLSTCPLTDMSPGAHSNFERNRGRFRIAIAFDSSSLRRAAEMTARRLFPADAGRT